MEYKVADKLDYGVESLLTSVEMVRQAFSLVGKPENKLGIDDSAWTDAEFEAVYKDTVWMLLFNPPYGGVLHAMTDLNKGQGFLWESFAIVENREERHSLHFPFEKWPDPIYWSDDTPSPGKPHQIFGKAWCAYRTKNMTPYLIWAVD